MRYPAELYVALHSGTPGDAAFYRRVCRDARSVLDLGCGNGRILWGLRRPGRSLVGLDRDREMLQLARRHAATDGRSALPSGSAVAGFRGGERGKRLGSAPTWVQADMAAFALGRRFDAIILPFSGF